MYYPGGFFPKGYYPGGYFPPTTAGGVVIDSVRIGAFFLHTSVYDAIRRKRLHNYLASVTQGLSEI